ncbi:MAG: SlyX family protein [Gammaproteobacteria bacterium]|nr:SlyX family protein [Gammaproteobacteria bacterium]MBU1489468.1 SlyX family protein [Gammaproteobacteria bacterium]MBU2140378.1 SlyX family protein [Gammaproteobacteria bacterium]MBU2321675.1 SlyX family protein [Gammaproteobacteria bacterium]
MSESRLTELESRQAFQDDTLQALNDIVVQQQRQIERLQLQVEALARRLQAMSVQFDIADDETPPPHY